MKSWLILFFLVFFALTASGQMGDTTVYETPSAALAAPWLKGLHLPSSGSNLCVLYTNIGPMMVPPQSRMWIDTFSMGYYFQQPFYANDLQAASERLQRMMILGRKIGVRMMRSPTFLPWGGIEAVQGSYEWKYVDSTVKYANLNGIELLGTIIPYSEFAQACQVGNPTCNIYSAGGDYFFLNTTPTGPICTVDTPSYYNWILQMVERYDGDGLSDMPGLTQGITYWEFGNEPEGPCGNYDSLSYVRDFLMTDRIMQMVCPSCQLLNGGEFIARKPYWDYVLDHIYPALDVGNVHSNAGKSAPSYNWTPHFSEHTRLMQDKIDQYQLNIPIWMTEWGFYSQNPQGLPMRTEAQQAAIYAKFYVWGMANNLERYFYDFFGTDVSTIGSSALLSGNGAPMDSMRLRLAGYTLKLYDYKFVGIDSARMFLFDTTGNFGVGHVRAWKAGHRMDVLWGVNNLPGDIMGVKLVTDINGNQQVVDVSTLSFPLATSPVVIEDSSGFVAMNMQVPISVRLAPNPARERLRVDVDGGYAGTLRLVNAFGQVVHQNALQVTQIVDLSGLADGLYFVVVEAEGQRISRRMVVQK
jgi:hypothetical protein